MHFIANIVVISSIIFGFVIAETKFDVGIETAHHYSNIYSSFKSINKLEKRLLEKRNTFLSTDPCTEKTCSGQGTCIWNEAESIAECFCNEGFSGNDCEIDACNGKECGENGKCEWDEEDSKAKCKCTNGYTGENCETDPCAYVNCGKNGKCAWDGNSAKTKCECINGYTGEKCETDSCNDVDCGNNGKCVWDVNGAKTKCECINGYTGEKCETDPCEGKHCSGHGTCTWDPENDNTKCDCLSEFIGEECQIHVCTEKTCSGQGTCIWNEAESIAECFCNGGFSGNDCETDACAGKECGENGKCEWDEEDSKVKCKCTNGYTGENCETDPCAEVDCGKNGKCTWDENDAKTKCECINGYTGEKCEKDPCNGKHCSGHGTCTWDPEKDNIKCDCHLQFIGEECQFHACTEKNCSGQGTCKWNEAEGIAECLCKEGFSGNDCEIDPCSDVDCGKNGNCAWDEKGAKTKCECLNGYTGDKCEKDPCTNVDCGKNGNCIWNENTKCECKKGWTGDKCEKKISWCESNGKEICGNTKCMYDEKLEHGYCSCETNDAYFDREKKICLTIKDQCAVRKFRGECSMEHETCSNGECKCEDNYIYSENNAFCEPDFCGTKRKLNKCERNEDCLDLGGGKIICVCKDGFYTDGTSCKEDRCSSSKCKQRCRPSTGECYCSEGFKLDDDNFSCSIIDKEKSCDKDCGPGSCIKLNKEEKCICPQYTHVAINGTCLDKCTANRLPSGVCAGKKCELNDKHGFRCKCEGIYKQHEDGIHCQRKLMCTEEGGENDCLKKSATCVEDRSTKNSKGYKCVCQNGYAKDENEICTKKCDLKKSRDFCDKQLATCSLNAQYAVVCKCPPFLTRTSINGPCNGIEKNSFIGNLTIKKDRYQSSEKDGVNMKEAVDYVTLTADLEESLKGVYGNLQDMKLLNCEENFDSLFCSVEIQFGETFIPEQTNLIASPSACVALDDNYCWVHPNLFLDRNFEKIFRKTDPCMKNVKEKLCGDNTKCSSASDSTSFQCTCAEGFYSSGSYNPTTTKDTFIQNCLDIDECLNPTSCPSSTDCLNTYGSYECLCKNGYRKTAKNEDPKVSGCIAVCNPNPCAYGSCEKFGDHGFLCNCDGSYTGYFCNTTNSVLSSYIKMGNQKAGIVGGILGAALCLTLLAGYLFYRRLQKRDSEMDIYNEHRQESAFAEMPRQTNHPIDSAQGDVTRRREQRLPSGEYQKGYGRGSQDGSLELHEAPLKASDENNTEIGRLNQTELTQL